MRTCPDCGQRYTPDGSGCPGCNYTDGGARRARPTTCPACGHYLPTGTHGDDACLPEPDAPRGRP